MCWVWLGLVWLGASIAVALLFGAFCRVGKGEMDE